MTKTDIENRQIVSNTPSIIEGRFLAKIRESSSGCWLWVGAHWEEYGQMTIERCHVKAHHVSWMLYRGPLPEDPDICILHTCDIRPCVNPDHLFLGTRVDNMQDAARKGRIANAKLTVVEVREIRDAEELFSQRNLAVAYGVSQKAIWGVLRGKTYIEI